jgi:hypothetical protein
LRSPHLGHRSVHGPYDIGFEPILRLAATAPLILYAAELLATHVGRGWHRLLLADLLGQPYPKSSITLTELIVPPLTIIGTEIAGLYLERSFRRS